MATEKQTVLYELEFDDSGAIKSFRSIESAAESATVATEKLSESTTDYSSALSLLDTQLGGVVTKSKQSVSALKGITVGLKGVRLALVATGIGAFIVLLGSLVAFFTKSEKGTKALAVSMEFLGDIMSPVLDLFVLLGEGVFGFIGALTGLDVKLEESIRLEKELNDELERTNRLTDERALTLHTLKKALSDESKSISERTILLFNAEKILSESYESEISSIQELIKERSLAGESVDDLTLQILILEGKRDDEIQQLGELLNYTGDYTKEIEDNTKAIKENEEAEFSRLKAQLEADAVSGRLSRVEADRQIARIGILEEEGNIRRQLSDITKDDDDALEQQATLFESLGSNLLALFQNTVQNEKLSADQRRVIQAQYHADVRALGQEQADFNKELAESDVKLTEDTSAQKIAIANIALSALSNGIKAIFGENKASAIATTIINTAQGIMNSFASLPTPAAIVASAGIAALGAVSIAKISSTEIPKAEKGGIIGGQLHSNGGTIIEAERGEVILNRTSMANPQLLSIASAINEWGGGVGFAQQGGLVGGRETELLSAIEGLTLDAQVVLVTEDLDAVNNRVAVTESISTL